MVKHSIFHGNDLVHHPTETTTAKIRGCLPGSVNLINPYLQKLAVVPFKRLVLGGST